jgi:hypothetical protein
LLKNGILILTASVLFLFLGSRAPVRGGEAASAARPAAAPAPALDLSLAELIERNTRAMGGAAAIGKVQRIEVGLRIVEPTFKVEGTYVADRQGRMRIDVRDGGKRVYTEAFDGKQGWQQGPDGSPVASSGPKGSAALWHGTQFPGQILGLNEMAAHGHRLERIGREEIEGVNYYVLRLTLSDGFETYRYLNPKTWLIDRGRDVRALHPALNPDEKWLENRWTDYRPVGGTVRSYQSSQWDLSSGKQLQTTTIDSVKINPEIDPKLFERPKTGSTTPSS